jgi:hypothetical protein
LVEQREGLSSQSAIDRISFSSNQQSIKASMRSINLVPQLLRRASSSCNYIFQSNAFFTPFQTFSTTRRTLAKDDDKPDEEYKPRHYVPADPEEDPLERVKRVIKWDAKNTWDAIRFGKSDLRDQEAQIFPQFCDILIIGGGIMGSSIA